jgi:hypothetical protein
VELEELVDDELLLQSVADEELDEAGASSVIFRAERYPLLAASVPAPVVTCTPVMVRVSVVPVG